MARARRGPFCFWALYATVWCAIHIVSDLYKRQRWMAAGGYMPTPGEIFLRLRMSCSNQIAQYFNETAGFPTKVELAYRDF